MFKSSKIAEFMENTNLALSNAYNNEPVRSLLLEYNYDEPKFDAAFKLYDAAYAAETTHVKERGEQHEARKKFDALFDDAHKIYMEHVDFVKLLCRKKPKLQDTFGLHEPRKKTISGWLKQARVFYTNVLANPEILEDLTRYNLTKEKLEANLANVTAVAQANIDHKREKAEAQDAREKRDAAIEALYEIMYEFMKVCKYALKEHPQLMEALGVMTVSGSRRKKKKDANDVEEPVDIEESTAALAAPPLEAALITEDEEETDD